MTRLSAVVLGLLISLEVLCRVERDGIGAVANRVRFKLALLRNKGPVDFVVLGSSRANDGVQPALIHQGRGFLAATPASSLETLNYFASNVGVQKLVLVELSSPQWSSAPLEFDTPSQSDFSNDPIGEFLHSHSELLKFRRAFALENLPRIGGLLISAHLDGSEWFRRPSSNVAPLTETWTPVEPSAGELDEDAPRIIDGYVQAIESLRRNGARVVLFAPPLAKMWRVEDCVPSRNATRAAVKARTGVPLLDFTCTEVDDRWFVDGQHLNGAGREQFSKTLAEALRGLP